MQTLKDLCKEGHTVISSIHQPRSSIFAMFDDLILLSEGRMLYSGPADQALSYFEQLGHRCPQHYNPAEFLADIISVDASTPEAQQRTRQATVVKCAAAARAGCNNRHRLDTKQLFIVPPPVCASNALSHPKGRACLAKQVMQLCVTRASREVIRIRDFWWLCCS